MGELTLLLLLLLLLVEYRSYSDSGRTSLEQYASTSHVHTPRVGPVVRHHPSHRHTLPHCSRVSHAVIARHSYSTFQQPAIQYSLSFSLSLFLSLSPRSTRATVVHRFASGDGLCFPHSLTASVMPLKPPSVYASFHLAAACLGATTVSYQTLHSLQLQHPPHAAIPAAASITRASSGNSMLHTASFPLKRDEPFDVRYQFTASQTV